MANWTNNILEVKDGFNLVDLGIIKDGQLDFNTILPLPEELCITAYGVERPLVYYLSNKLTIPEEIVKQNPILSKGYIFHPYTTRCYESLKQNPLIESDKGYKLTSKNGKDYNITLFELGEIYADNIKKFGYPTWLEWSLANWGTKWNASDCVFRCEEGGKYTSVFFETPNGAPYGFYEALSKKFPEIKFYTTSDDDDTGEELGTYSIIYENGVGTECEDTD